MFFNDNEEDMEKKRRSMVETQLSSRGIEDENVLQAFLEVPRERFVRSEDKSRAYDDRALPTRSGQTISQPYMVACMTEFLEVKPGHDVLEVGTGSGYQTAILSAMGANVFTMYEELTREAKDVLQELDLSGSIHFKVGDGTLGWEENAPYDRIIVTAGAPEVPEPLKKQLKEGGKIVIPVGSKKRQDIKVVTRASQQSWFQDTHTSCVFVPLVGEQGWDNESR
ncbi:MAG: protein-L-isoaspartate(D-aspartate) O-methyltransferase [bacterium]